jgi:hypothetical protein
VAAYRLFRMTGSARFSYDKIGHQTTTWLEEELSMPALIEAPLDLPHVRALIRGVVQSKRKSQAQIPAKVYRGSVTLFRPVRQLTLPLSG